MITCHEIGRVVCAHFVLDPKVFWAPGMGYRSVHRPRQMAMALCREFTGASYPKIAKAFSKRDHTTVYHAVRTMRALELEDIDVLRSMRALRRDIEYRFLTSQIPQYVKPKVELFTAAERTAA